MILRTWSGEEIEGTEVERENILVHISQDMLYLRVCFKQLLNSGEVGQGTFDLDVCREKRIKRLFIFGGNLAPIISSRPSILRGTLSTYQQAHLNRSPDEGHYVRLRIHKDLDGLGVVIQSMETRLDLVHEA